MAELFEFAKREPNIQFEIVDDPETINDVVIEVQGLDADYLRIQRERQIKLDAVSRVQDLIQKTGTSRTLMEEVQLISSNENALAERGIAIESFTTYPSKTNQRLSLEVSDEIKSGIIGAGIAASLFIVYKIARWVYEFFTKRASNKEKAKKETERAKANIKLLEALKEAAKGNDEMLKIIEDAEDAQAAKLDFDENSGVYNLMLHKFFYQKDSTQKRIYEELSSVDALDQKIMTTHGLIGSIVNALKGTVSDQGIKTLVERSINPMLTSLDVEKIKEQQTFFTGLYSQLKEDANQPAPVTEKDFEGFAKLTEGFTKLFDDFEKRGDMLNKLTLGKDPRFAENTKKLKEEIDEGLKRVQASTLSPEELKVFTDRITEVVDVQNLLFKVSMLLSTSYEYIRMHYNNFMKGFNRATAGVKADIMKNIPTLTKEGDRKKFEKLLKELSEKNELDLMKLKTE